MPQAVHVCSIVYISQLLPFHSNIYMEYNRSSSVYSYYYLL